MSSVFYLFKNDVLNQTLRYTYNGTIISIFNFNAGKVANVELKSIFFLMLKNYCFV